MTEGDRETEGERPKVRETERDHSPDTRVKIGDPSPTLQLSERQSNNQRGKGPSNQQRAQEKQKKRPQGSRQGQSCPSSSGRTGAATTDRADKRPIGGQQVQLGRLFERGNTG